MADIVHIGGRPKVVNVRGCVFTVTPLSYAVLTGRVHEAFVKMKLKVMSSSDPTLKRACKHVAPKLRNGSSATK